jgi:hypothetical protein
MNSAQIPLLTLPEFVFLPDSFVDNSVGRDSREGRGHVMIHSNVVIKGCAVAMFNGYGAERSVEKWRTGQRCECEFVI